MKFHYNIHSRKKECKMYYAYPKELKREIVGNKNDCRYICFDEELDAFVDINGKIVDIDGKKVVPFSDIFGLYDLIEDIEYASGIPVNSDEQINQIIHWFQSVEPMREFLAVTGDDFENLSVLTVLLERFGINGSIFLKTVDKDFHGIVSILEVLDPESSLRKAMRLHSFEEFLVESVIPIDEDQYGRQEYRAFIHNRQITSISRTLRHTYHRVPKNVVTFVEQVLQNLPKDFPDYFVIDVVSSNQQFDILELNPIETSAPYLYNSREIPQTIDLTHEEMIPPVHPKDCSFFPGEIFSSPIFEDVPGSFAKDYYDFSTSKGQYFQNEFFTREKPKVKLLEKQKQS